MEDDKGRWRLEPAQLDELQLLPPSDFSGTMTVTVQASSAFEDEAELPSALMTVDVAAVADPPALVVSEARGEAGTPIELAISASLGDLDGSERLSLAVENLPKRFTLSAGRRAAHGTWRLEPEDLGTLALESPADYRGRFALKVVARADESNGSFAETVATLPVIVEGVVVAAPEPEPVEAGTLESDAAETAASAEPPAAQSDADPEVAAPANDWIARGDQLLSLGDIAAARLFYELAAQQGHAEAATAMGRTYDPAFLKERKVIGVPGNPALAAEWYRRAAEAGDPEAQSLLERTSGQP